jgi:hypothetical protein
MSEFTGWFSVKVNPVRDGVYAVYTPNNNGNKFSYFDKKHGWRLCAYTIKAAYGEKSITEDLDFSSMRLAKSKWRGLAKKP